MYILFKVIAIRFNMLYDNLSPESTTNYLCKGYTAIISFTFYIQTNAILPQKFNCP